MAQVTSLTGRPEETHGQGRRIDDGSSASWAHFAGSPMVLTEIHHGRRYGVYRTMTGDYGGADIRQMLARSPALRTEP
jgi:hypothetical protein